MTSRTISDYGISDKLGEGGMGVLYKAEDEKLQRASGAPLYCPSGFFVSQDQPGGYSMTRRMLCAFAAALVATAIACSPAEAPREVQRYTIEQFLSTKMSAFPWAVPE